MNALRAALIAILLASTPLAMAQDSHSAQPAAVTSAEMEATSFPAAPTTAQHIAHQGQLIDFTPLGAPALAGTPTPPRPGPPPPPPPRPPPPRPPPPPPRPPSRSPARRCCTASRSRCPPST